MTCREKLAIERPDLVDKNFPGGAKACPVHYGYINEEDGDGCNKFTTCSECWDQEIPEPKEETKLIYAHVGDPVDIPEKPIIKDSGNRREFESGAVRDMQEGKGRCDLMPLEVVSKIVNEDSNNPDPIVNSIALFQKSRDTKHLYYALEHFAGHAFTESNLGASCCTMCLEVAKHFEEGAKKYGESNWKFGIPCWCYVDSAVRHYIKWRRGDKDEPHDKAFVWNLMCCIWEVDYHKTTVEAVK